MTTIEQGTTPQERGPNIVQYVRADQIKPGDKLLVLTTIWTVVTVQEYILAGRPNDQVVYTSNTEYGNRWPVLHFLTNYGGLVRFPHEDIARLARIDDA